VLDVDALGEVLEGGVGFGGVAGWGDKCERDGEGRGGCTVCGLGVGCAGEGSGIEEEGCGEVEEGGVAHFVDSMELSSFKMMIRWMLRREFWNGR